MLNNPAKNLYHNIDRRIKRQTPTAKPRSASKGLLSKSVETMDKKENNITQPMERVASYVTMIRERRESEV